MGLRWIEARAIAALAMLAGVGAPGSVAGPEVAAPSPDFSGWRGGIGITFGTPSRDIADVTEMGYDIVWGGEDPRAARTLGISVFRYWNSIVETSLKGQGYDFSQMPDKEAAARLAFDAWMERVYGVKGLSKFATVRYHPAGAYGDVAGSMDLTGDNDLVKAVIAKYVGGFEQDGIVRGGIGLDNAGKVPSAFLEALSRRLGARGLGIAANGCPDEYLKWIDFFGNEGFPFSIDYARRARDQGLRGILGEFTMQHLSGGELESYLRSKLFNGIVFFGYTNGGTAAGARYSGYCSRPDVYEHQRWVLRKLVPISRAVQRAGRQPGPGARLATASLPEPSLGAAPAGVAVDAEGRVKEQKRREAGRNAITGRSPQTAPAIVQFGRDPATGLYLFVDSAQAEEVICDAESLHLEAEVLVFDEFTGSLLESKWSGKEFRFRTREGPCVVQLGSAPVLVKTRLGRMADHLRLQQTQRVLDAELGNRLPRKVWSRFCQAGKWDQTVARTGRSCFAVTGGTYTGTMPQWKYFNRQGTAQLVTLNQQTPQPVAATAFSKAQDVLTAQPVNLDTPAARRHHFDAREGHTYALHLYLDYQDGTWPEVHSASFSPGTHDWEERTIQVRPERPVKTAMVLLEFHQPQGAAWFDDVTLSCGETGRANLLAVPGFEQDDAGALSAGTFRAAYEEQVRALLGAMEAARPAVADIRRLKAQAGSLAATVRGKNLGACFARELRDCDDAGEKLELCAQFLYK